MLYRLRRSPRLWWLCVISLAIVCGIVVQGIVKNADLKEQRFGTLITTYVASRDVPAGNKLANKDIAKRSLPKALLPHNAVTKSPANHATLIPLTKGEAILSSHLAPSGLQGAAALLPAGHRAIAVPVSTGTPDVHIGNSVDVIVAFDQPTNDAIPTARVAQNTTVIAADREKITIAVLPQEIEGVTYAITNGTVTLVLTSQPRQH